jgi:hypothetical protein
MTPEIESIAARVLELAEKATKGPWERVSSMPHMVDEMQTHSVSGPPSDFMFLRNIEDSNFIAFTRTAAPTLAREWEKEHAENVRLREQLRIATGEVQLVYRDGRGREVFPPSPNEGWHGETFTKVSEALDVINAKEGK